ncbi:MAG: carboxylating nicotinate-nucleotide diphosphorylase [Methylococcaceae bacterium]|jgi:nicotinate-nucleotide pyrophosphorylase (carboxylating)|nr:carboxylating nicotinate-nucleotide diphosphorylase [Methylococcaceae bacterium]MDD1637801.1 carboxylating nicotinate-nucleotide diphosphorylase [Methylococcaceae bacterium]MDD1642149.1 carboxylating nicotinate-nucleotide diphosphorylase [Methylococcaceae bacterium]OYV21312.1 MAG: nicotinate-nucleotide pyrophosphorylase (carboxylating) [Methylococcaceae bacterium NSM2-1]
MTVPLNIIDITSFLDEDIGSGDITAAIIPEAAHAQAEVVTREDMMLCGQAWFDAVLKHLDANVNIIWLAAEGEAVKKNTTLCKLSGSARGLLTGERTALNLLQLLSATATVSRQYADAVAGTGCKVLDTRKTIPGLRNAQKYAVVCGGCYNHRIGLYDGVLIKENHIMAAGSISRAIQAARKLTTVAVEVEVESMKELIEAIAAKPDRIMLDNFSLEAMRAAVKLNAGAIELEASGNIDLDNIRSIAETGVDYISIGALTKNVKAVDLSMRIKLVTRV